MAPINLGEGGVRGPELTTAVAPPWTRGRSAKLDNGTQLLWLSEKDRPDVDIRLIFPLSGPDESAVSSAATLVVFSALEQQLAGRLDRADLQLRRADRPGRVELAVHAASDQFALVLQRFGQSLAAKAPMDRLAQAQGMWVGHAPQPFPESVASRQIETLLGVELHAVWTTASAVSQLSEDDLKKAWDLLCDPRRVTMVVHSAPPTDAQYKTLDRFAEAWKRPFWRKGKSIDPIERLFQPLKIKRGRGPSLRQSPMTAVATLAPTKTGSQEQNEGPIIWLASRPLQLNNHQDRAFARLSQRMLQHDFDVRLVIHGKVGLWQLRIVLPPDPPIAAEVLRERLAKFEGYIGEDLFLGGAHQAARTWLGARLVRASLSGEDWSDLWSQSLDLSETLQELPNALQKVGESMLSSEKEALQAWIAQNIHPQSAPGPWISELLGSTPASLQALNLARTQGPVEKKK